MLIRKSELERIAAGEITVAFRRWRRPTVAAGGTLRTAIGELAIESVDRIREEEIGDADARGAGFTGVESLRAELARRSEGELYRIRFRVKGPDPRLELRERSELGEEEWREVLLRLDRLDRASRTGPWTQRALEAIDGGEGVHAADLARLVDQKKEAFKVNVRKLKNLGLTESLGTGYRISPRGAAVLARLRAIRSPGPGVRHGLPGGRP